MHEAELHKLLEDEQAEPDISARQFLLKTLLWLPFCFAGWYLLGAVFSWPAIWLSDLLLPWTLPDLMRGVEQQGYWVDIVTNLYSQAADGQVGYFIMSFNILKYGYGFPLIIAMMLATPYSLYNKLDDMSYGLVVVILAQTWGIVFEAWSTLLMKTGASITNQVDQLIPYANNDIYLSVIALGYQLGSLLFPAVVPIAFWIMRHQGLLERLSKR